MNLHVAWKQWQRRLIEAAAATLAAFRSAGATHLAERRTRRAIAKFDALPNDVLRDIGVQRDAIPLIVSRTAAAKCVHPTVSSARETPTVEDDDVPITERHPA